MGAPDSGMQAAEQLTAETLLTAFRTIKDADRAKHRSVLVYWLSIRGDKEFPPLHDLDPLEISDAGPCSILLELIGGGQDAEIRHLGEALKEDVTVQRIIDAPNPSILACIAKKLPIVAISRDFIAFEDSFDNADGWTRCWVTLLPLSSCGSWVDYVYALVSVETNRGKAVKAPELSETVDAPPEVAPADEVVAEQAEVITDVPAGGPETVADVTPSVGDDPDESSSVEPVETAQGGHESEADETAETTASSGPGFAKLIDGFANLAGFYGQGIKADPVVNVDVPAIEPPVSLPPVLELTEINPAADPEEPAVEPVATEPLVDELPEEAEPEPTPQEAAPEPAPISEGALLNKLSEVRAKADEARMAQLRATAALHEGLSAAYDFALDAETSPEEYLRLVEAEGMKIQLRAPMAPVVKLAFNGLADAMTIAELETVLAWALKQELPRGSLAQRIEEAGGIDELLSGATPPS
jgi:hypothetical protein